MVRCVLGVRESRPVNIPASLRLRRRGLAGVRRCVEAALSKRVKVEEEEKNGGDGSSRERQPDALRLEKTASVGQQLEGIRLIGFSRRRKW